MPTAKQIGMVRAILAQMGVETEADKRQAILNLTGGRTGSVSELTHAEVGLLKEKWQGADPREKMIRKIIAQAIEMGWTASSPFPSRGGGNFSPGPSRGGGQVDMVRLNGWAMKHTPYHQPLDALSYEQLTQVVTIFEKVYISFLKGL